MKFPLPCLGIVALLACAPAIAAQTVSPQSPLPRRDVVASAYDLSKEVAVQGAIQEVVGKPTAGLMYGGHLIVATPQGSVDIQIGKFGLGGRDTSSFHAGEQVRAIGMMSAFGGRAVLLARLVQTSDGTIEIRNENGGEVSPAARKAFNAGGAQ